MLFILSCFCVVLPDNSCFLAQTSSDIVMYTLISSPLPPLTDQTHRKHIVQTFKPTPESNSFSRPVSDMNVASGCPTFSKLAVFDVPDNDYVKGDVMFVKCIVDTTRIFHP